MESLVQLEDGNWMQIDRRLRDEITKRNLSDRERIVIDKVLRLTYGCKRNPDQGRYCIVGNWGDFASACGIHQSAIMKTLDKLVEYRILYVDKERRVIVFNKAWQTWQVEVKKAYDPKKDSDLVSRNLNYTPIDEAIGNAAFTEMKKLYQNSKEFTDSVNPLSEQENTSQNDKGFTDSASKEFTDSVKFDSVEPHEIRVSEPLIESIAKERKSLAKHSKKLATLSEDLRELFRELRLPLTFQDEAIHYHPEDLHAAYDRFTDRQAELTASGQGVRSTPGFYMKILRDEFIPMEGIQEVEEHG